jgi:hypothetical protein
MLHLGGVGKYMSQIQDGLFIQGISCSAGVLSGCLAGMGTHLALEQNEAQTGSHMQLQGKRLLQLQTAHTSGSITRNYAQLPSLLSACKVGGI